MPSLQRQLVNLDILCDDLGLLDAHDYASAAHRKLLAQYQSILKQLQIAALDVTEAQYEATLRNTEFSRLLGSKRMIGVHIRLIEHVLEHWAASEKVEQILASEFDEKADRRLNLLQTKAVRARSLIKAVASAMGQEDYQRFAAVLGLAHPQWQWRALVGSN
ncbi:hypothetical protein DXV75_12325 [Alteromonas aestuariivivens]|uniref:Uncharacterized protein n=1 Tax=Alteromonas aestuariivivens TaxID=1938339 RepID=A0A3D8M5P3_9ALTE|nr:hypothetical protein [Alteromonas aestuariivivens]RDV24854.1 hypothetical protein DXV75_12325 [Alteromonas aestuariivivens]